MLGLKAKVLPVNEVNAVEQQSTTHQQEHRERDLEHNHHGTEPVWERPRDAARPSSFRFVVMSVRDAPNAGASPNSSAHNSVAPVANSSTLRSRLNAMALMAVLKRMLARSN